MERGCHHSVRSQKCFFDTVTVMAVNIDVQNSLVGFEKLDDTQNTVVGITKAGSFVLFSVMQTPSPINRDLVAYRWGDPCASQQGASSVPLTEVQHVVKDRAVIPIDREPVDLVHILFLILYGNGAKAVNIVV